MRLPISPCCSWACDCPATEKNWLMVTLLRTMWNESLLSVSKSSWELMCLWSLSSWRIWPGGSPPLWLSSPPPLSSCGPIPIEEGARRFSRHSNFGRTNRPPSDRRGLRDPNQFVSIKIPPLIVNQPNTTKPRWVHLSSQGLFLLGEQIRESGRIFSILLPFSLMPRLFSPAPHRMLGAKVAVISPRFCPPDLLRN